MEMFTRMKKDRNVPSLTVLYPLYVLAHREITGAWHSDSEAITINHDTEMNIAGFMESLGGLETLTEYLNELSGKETFLVPESPLAFTVNKKILLRLYRKAMRQKNFFEVLYWMTFVEGRKRFSAPIGASVSSSVAEVVLNHKLYSIMNLVVISNGMVFARSTRQR